jgi:hypothetical protein
MHVIPPNVANPLMLGIGWVDVDSDLPLLCFHFAGQRLSRRYSKDQP